MTTIRTNTTIYIDVDKYDSDFIHIYDVIPRSGQLAEHYVWVATMHKDAFKDIFGMDITDKAGILIAGGNAPLSMDLMAEL